MTATAIRNEVISYINELPEDKLSSALDYVRSLREKKHPWEATCIEDVYRSIEEGLDDLENGRCEPFEDTMRDLRKMVATYEV
ncbi:MAG: hypothetical protein FWB80_07025 [Defluviitaleaceae bacterium]|nr:hypothetical protein [Defluviitaleaceae bacterium]